MRILLVKTSSLGDVIHNLPVASDIAARLPGAQIDWVVEEAFAALPRLHPAVRRVIPVAVRRWRKAPFSAATWREIGHYRRVASADFFDAVIDTQGLVKSAVLTSLARGPKFGHASPRERLAALAYDTAIEIAPNQHAVMRNRRLAAAALGYSLDGLPLDYGLVAPPLSVPWLPAGDYAVLLTATSRADKEWPEGHWLALGQALIAMGMRCVLPGGSRAERERATRLAATLGRALATPPLGLTELAGLLAGARLVIGVDTGLTHLAAALDRPTVALFCASEPRLTGVFAGKRAINLGGAGAPPRAAEVLSSAQHLLNIP